AVTQKPRGQVQCLIEKFADAVAGVFIGRLLSHTVSISSGLYSGNLTQGFCTTQQAFHRPGRPLPRQSSEGHARVMRTSLQSAPQRRPTPPIAPSRSTTVTD